MHSAALGTGRELGMFSPGHSGMRRKGAGVVLGPEIVSRRTVNSDTYWGSDGGKIVRIYAAPINYRNAAGRMVPINDTLHRRGASFVNQADSYHVSIPSTLNGRSAVRVSRGPDRLSFILMGARGVAQVTRSNVVGFGPVLPSTSVTWVAAAGRVKEDLQLANRAAPSSFRFLLRLAPGARAVVRLHGIVEVLNPRGKVAFLLPEPFLIDRAGALGRVAVRLQRVQAGYLLSLAPDQTWLRAKSRRWPVVLDPSIGASTDCTIVGGSGASQNSCASTSDTIGVVNGNPERALMYFDIDDNLSADYQIVYAALHLNITGWSNSSPFQVGVYPLTRSFTSGATWNTYDGTNAWTTPGGDFDSSPQYTWTPATSTGWTTAYLTQLVQKWTDGTRATNGLVVKATGENVANSFTIDSANATDGNTPYIEVDCWDRMGYPRGSAILHTHLTPRLDLGVNVANGNVILREQDMHIAGTGQDFNLARTYNGINVIDNWLGVGTGFFGTGSPYLYQYPDGGIAFHDENHTTTLFTSTGTGTWSTSPGSDLTICQVGVGPGCSSSGVQYTVWIVGFPDGSTWDFNQWGDLRGMFDKNGNLISDYWATSAGPSSFTDTQGRQINVTRDANNNISSIADPSGRSIGFTYDANYDPLTFTDANGGVTQYTWNSNPQLTQIIDPNGNKTLITYNADSWVTSIEQITNPTTGAGDTTTFTYNASTSPIPGHPNGCPSPPSGEIPFGQSVVTDPNSHAAYYCYDTHDRVYAAFDADGNWRQTTFSPDDSVAQFTDPSGANTTLTYDQNRPSQGTEPASAQGQTPASTHWSYNAGSTHPWYPDTSTDAQNNQLTFGYDSASDLTSITDPLSTQNNQQFTYNSNGTLATSTDADGNKTTYGYTSGNLTSITPPAATNGIGATSIGYDTLSRAISVKDGKGQTETIAYDKLDQITKETFGDGSTISYTYDKDGNLTQQTDSVAGTSTYGYDAKNRITQENLPGGHTNNYTYDSANNLLTVQDPGGTTTYVYNELNELCYLISGTTSGTCSSPPSGAITFGYNTNGRRTNTTYPTSPTRVSINDTYWPAGQLKNLTASGPGGTIANLTYNYQKGTSDQDLLQTRTDSVANKVTCYPVYDALNRLKQAITYSGATCGGTTLDNRQYSYDGDGNILTRTINSGSPTTYAYNADNELCWQLPSASSNGCGSPPSGATTYTYDKNGNETGNSSGLVLTYNAKNQTASIKPAGGSTDSLTYDGDGQGFLTQIGSTSQTNDLLGVGYRTDSTGTTYYTHDPNGELLSERLPSGSTYYYIPDSLGSVIDLTDSSGNTANTYSYDPYGQTTTSTGITANVWGYAQGLQMPGGYYHFGQRYQDASIGRWTQQDPLLQPSDLVQADQYTYSGDNPVKYVDHSGLEECCGGGEGVPDANSLAADGLGGGGYGRDWGLPGQGPANEPLPDAIARASGHVIASYMRVVSAVVGVIGGVTYEIAHHWGHIRFSTR